MRVFAGAAYLVSTLVCEYWHSGLCCQSSCRAVLSCDQVVPTQGRCLMTGHTVSIWQWLSIVLAVRPGLAQLSKPLASNAQLDPPAKNKYWQRLATDDDLSDR